jgi:nitrite reductase (NO-forming)
MAGTQTQSSAAGHYYLWPKTALRVGFGTIWLIDAVLKWLPGFRADYMSTIMGEADGQPGWTRPWFDFWINLQHPDAVFFAYLVAVVETLIAAALIVGFARKVTYTAAIAFSVLIWGTAEGFGGPYTSGASDIGTAIVYAVVFAALLGFAYYLGTSRLSVDYYLEQRISWWHWMAEVGRRNQPKAQFARRPTASPSPTPQHT